MQSPIRLSETAKRRLVSLLLLLAEINLTLILLRNMSIFYAKSIFIYGDLGEVIYQVSTVLISIFASLLTIRTMFGLPSSRRGSWRSTVRKLITISVMAVVVDLLNLNYSPVDVRGIVILSSIVLVIMFLPSIRRYHTPYLAEVPPLKYWIKAVFILPDNRADRYRFVYAEDE